MRRMLLLFCALLAGPALAPSALAQERRVALVVGVAGYRHAPELTNPLNDAVDMAATLTGMGFQVVEAYDPDYAALQRALRDFGRALEGAQVGLVYYAGHGVQVDGRNYLLPVDATLSDDASVQREGVEATQVFQLLANAQRIGLVLLDACRDNPLAANLARRAGAARSLAVAQGLAQVGATAADTLVIYSTQPGAVAGDGVGRNSRFTGALLHEIGTPGLDVQDLMRRVRARVLADTNGLQVPWDNSSLTKGFAFVPGPRGAVPAAGTWSPPPRDPTPRQLDLQLWNDVKKGGPEELDNYLRQYPNGLFAGAARARLAALQREAQAGQQQAQQMASAIAREFAALAGRGELVPDPKEPHEFYANARFYEQRGDFLNARRAYLRYIQFGRPQVDPHYRFQSFLRVQEGRAGAREVYQELLGNRANDEALVYATALLQEPEERKARLERILAARPDFAPAFYELARNFSQATLGTQTLSDRAREKELLERFVSLADRGRFLGWFLDQQVAAEQLEDARRRLASLNATAVALPVSLRTMSHSGGWTLVLLVQEPVQELLVTLPGEAERSTGFTGVPDPRTGRPAPRTTLELPVTAPAMTLQLRYRDAAGALRGPFPLAFDPAAEALKGAKDILEATANSWLSFRTHDGVRLLYFTHLAGLACVLAEARYALDAEVPRERLALPPCNPNAPGRMPDGFLPYLTVPPATRFATVQLRFRDGTETVVRRFAAE